MAPYGRGENKGAAASDADWRIAYQPAYQPAYDDYLGNLGIALHEGGF